MVARVALVWAVAVQASAVPRAQVQVLAVAEPIARLPSQRRAKKKELAMQALFHCGFVAQKPARRLLVLLALLVLRILALLATLLLTAAGLAVLLLLRAAARVGTGLGAGLRGPGAGAS